VGKREDCSSTGQKEDSPPEKRNADNEHTLEADSPRWSVSLGNAVEYPSRMKFPRQLPLPADVSSPDSGCLTDLGVNLIAAVSCL